MEQNLGELSTDELNDLYRAETSHFKNGFDTGIPFNELKKIRVLIRTIEEELNKRK